MSIHLDEEDRARLKRLEGGTREPTRRQKAVALLRLDEGLPPAQVAIDSGLSKEQVEALAARFAGSGLAGVGLGEKAKVRIRLLRPGHPVERFCLVEGTTLAELLRRAGVATMNRVILMDGAPVEEKVLLQDGAVVTIVPTPRNASADQPWRATIPSFRDEALYQQYRDILETRRTGPGSVEDEEA